MNTMFKKQSLSKRLLRSNAVKVLALFVLLCGGATAWAANSITINSITPSSTVCMGATISVDFTADSSTIFTDNSLFTIQLSDGAGGFGSPITLGNYRWVTSDGKPFTKSQNVTIPFALSAPTTGYLVRVVHGSLTSNNSTLTISIPSIVVTASTSSICHSGLDTLTANGIGLGGTYSWSPAARVGTTTLSGGVGTASVTPISPATIFTVVGTDAAGCHDTVTQTISVNDVALPIFGGASTICSLSSTAAFNDTTAGGTWSTVFGFATIDNATRVATGISAGIDSIKYTVNNACGVSVKTKPITVFGLPNVSFTATPSTVFCSGGSVTLTATGASNYVWSATSGTVTATGATRATENYTATTAAGVQSTYNITVTGTDGNSCQSQAVRTFTVNPMPVMGAGIVGSNTGCAAPSITLSTIALTDTAVSDTINWVSTTPSVATVSGTGVVFGASAGTTTIRYILTNAFSCKDSSSKTITINQTPDITQTIDSLCNGQTIAAYPNSTSRADSLKWSVNSPSGFITGYSNPISFRTLISDRLSSSDTSSSEYIYYLFTTKNTLGCTDTGTVSYKVKPGGGRTSSFITNYSFCSGSPYTINLSGSNLASNYTWTRVAVSGPLTVPSINTGTNTITDTFTNASYTVGGTVTYAIVATDISGGCSNNLGNIRVSINPLPKIGSPSRTKVCSDDSLVIDLNPITSVSCRSFFQNYFSIPGTISGCPGTITNDSIALFLSSSIDSLPVIVKVAVTATSDSGCAGTPDTLGLTVYPRPNMTHSAFPLSKSICSGTGTAIALSSTTGSGSSYKWTVATSGSVTGADSGADGRTILNQTLTSTNIYSVEAVTYNITPISPLSFNGCVGFASTATISVNPSPLVTSITPNTNVCNQTAVNVGGINLSTSGKLKWRPDTSSIVTNAIADSNRLRCNPCILTTNSLNNITGGTPGTVRYIVSVISDAGCNSLRDTTLNITVQPTISYTGRRTDSICNVSDVGIDLTSSYIYFGASAVSFNNPSNNVDSSNSSLTNDRSTPVLILENIKNKGNGQADIVTYHVVPTILNVANAVGATCPGIPDSIKVTVFPTPIISNLSSIKPICSQSRIDFNPTFSSVGTIPLTAPTSIQFKTVANTNHHGFQQSGSGFSDTLTSNFYHDIVTAQYQYNFKINLPIGASSGGCPTSQTISFPIYPSPEMPAITPPNDTVVCSGSQLIHFERNAADSGVSYQWASFNTSNHSPATDTLFASRNNQEGVDVTFTSAGYRWIRIRSYILQYNTTAPGDQCGNYDSVKIKVRPETAFKNLGVELVHDSRSSILSCDYWDVAKDPVKTQGYSYRWSREDTGTLVAQLIANVDADHPANYQYYVLPSGLDPDADLSHNYFVQIYDSSNTCPQRAYYKRGSGHKPNFEDNQDISMVVYPNPVKSTLNILLSDASLTGLEFEAWDMTGKKVLKFSAPYPASTCSTDNLAPGVYHVICFHDGKKIASTEFIKQ